MSPSQEESEAAHRRYVVRRPTAAELERAGLRLFEVLLLAEALPSRHEPTLRHPPLTRFTRANRRL